MTDYLEELLEKADALMNQVQRLERGYYGRENADFKAETSNINQKNYLVDDKETGINQKEDKVYDQKPAPSSKEMEQTEERERQAAALSLEENRRRAERPALLAQLERMEQMSTVMEQRMTGAEQELTTAQRSGRGGDALTLAGRQRGALPFSELEAPEGGWTSVSGAGFDTDTGSSIAHARSGVQSDAALDWAEQADRAFRRDSRRYDGGFCLY